MILVILGTQQNDFHRLLKEIEKNIKNNTIKEKVIAQIGSTKFKSNKMELFDMISRDKLEKLVDDANLIITHGGVGSIIMALKKQKRIIAVPRLSKFGEHVNDHQLQIVDTFNKKGYLIGIKSVEELPIALQKVENFIPKKYESNTNKIIAIIEEFIDNI